MDLSRIYLAVICQKMAMFDQLNDQLLKALVVKNSVLHDFGFGKVSPAKQL